MKAKELVVSPFSSILGCGIWDGEKHLVLVPNNFGKEETEKLARKVFLALTVPKSELDFNDGYSEGYQNGTLDAPAAPVAVVEPQRERFIDAEMLLDTVKPYSSGPHPFIPYVVESDHPRFVRGTRLDWGFVSCALQDGYDLQIKAASDCATNLAIADYEERNGKCDWINWRRADSQRKEGAGQK